MEKYRGEDKRWPITQATWLTPKILIHISEFQKIMMKTAEIEDDYKQLFQRLNIQQDFWRSHFRAFMFKDKILLEATGRFAIKEGYPMYVLKNEIPRLFPALPSIFLFTRAPLIKDISVIVLDEVPYSSTAKTEKAVLAALNKYGHSTVGRQDWILQGVLRLPVCLTAQDSSQPNSHCMDNPLAIAIPLWEVGVGQTLRELLNEVLPYPVPVLAIETKRFIDLHLQPIRKDHKVFNASLNLLDKDYFGEINKFLLETGKRQIRW